MPLSVEELLKPRYKVIADWQGNRIPINTIIQLNIGPDERFQNGNVPFPYAYTENGAEAEYTLSPYPHLFQKLEWWQERTEEEMPEYVKGFGKVYDLKKVSERNETGFVIDHPMTEEPVPFNRCLPATLEDYDFYQSTVK